MNALSEEQFRRNELSRSAWELYQPHRERVTQLLLNLIEPDARPDVCILGAGNCNDVDLNRVLSRASHIHLVDLDEAALRAGLITQQLTIDSRIRLHGGVDVTGCVSELAGLSPASTSAAVEGVAQRLIEQVPFRLTQRCGVVASVGLISQLVELAVKCVGTSHSQFLRLTQALRTQHLRQLFELTDAGGHILLTSEIVSSDTAPEILQTPEPQLAELTTRLINANNFFTGLHPGILLQSFQADARIAPQLKSLQLTSPWLWPFVARTYACCAIVAQRHS